MSRSVLAFCGVLVVVPLLVPPVTPAAAPPKPEEESDAFFERGGVIRVAVDAGPKGADALRRKPREYVPATVTVGGTTYRDVGVHLRGAVGSFRGFDDKPGLTLNMDKFTPGQRFHGMDKFHLANSLQDPSYLSELICGELCRAAGVPASRVGHAVVTLNGRVRGVYYLKEGYDKYFLKRHFKTSDGNFYDGGFVRDIDQPLELLSGKGDVADRADLKALVAAANERDHAKRLDRLEKVLDFDTFLGYMAVAAITWDWDSYPFKANNYRVYHNPATDKITFIPSGMDQMFADVNGPAVPGFGGLVARRIMETAEGKKRYAAKLAAVMKQVNTPDDWTKRLDELEKVVQPAVAAVDAGAGRDYKNHVNRLRTGLVQRLKSVSEQLKKLPP